MKCALITGASRGIGRAVALSLAGSGNYPLLVLTARKNLEALTDLKKEICEKYPAQSVLTTVGDAGDPAYAEELCSEITRSGGNVVLLINNAGIAWTGLLKDMTPAEWDEIIRTNLSSLYTMSRAFSPMLIRAGEAARDLDLLHDHEVPSESKADPETDCSKPNSTFVSSPSSVSGGRIINISSVWGAVGASCEVAYSATKGGVTAFTKALAKELAPSRVAVNCIELGAVDTEMNGHLSPEDKEALAEEIPYGRFATPEEAAKAVLLLSEMPLYVTGATLRMDGGWI